MTKKQPNMETYTRQPETDILYGLNKLRVLIFKEDVTYIAHCVDYNWVAQSRNGWGEALENLKLDIMAHILVRVKKNQDIFSGLSGVPTEVENSWKTIKKAPHYSIVNNYEDKFHCKVHDIVDKEILLDVCEFVGDIFKEKVEDLMGFVQYNERTGERTYIKVNGVPIRFKVLDDAIVVGRADDII